MNMDMDNSIIDLLDNMQDEYNLDFLKNIQLPKISRKRQDAINKASKKSRDKKRKIYILMKEHIDKLHKLLSNHYIIDNNIIDNNIIDTINNYNNKVQKIKNE